MQRHHVVRTTKRATVVVTAVVSLLVVGLSVGSAGATTTWQNAQAVPGSVALNQDGYSRLVAVSCSTPGGNGDNCGAGGYYLDGAGELQGYVVDEVNGAWGSAMEVPGLAVLNNGNDAGVTSVSCSTPGSAGNNCAVVGFVTVALGDQEGFVDDEINGHWEPAEVAPGSSTVNALGGEALVAVSCSTPGSAGNNCAAGGFANGAAGSQGIVIDEVDGTWGAEQVLPGSAALNVDENASVLSASCVTPGNSGNSCAVAGYYEDASGSYQGFVADEVNGSWGATQEVPGQSTLNVGGQGESESVSCASKGVSGNDCAVVGTYVDGTSNEQDFVADEVNGTWGGSQEVPGLGALDAGGAARLDAVSCGAVGASGNDCALVGSYVNSSPAEEPYVADEVNGTWGSAQTLPGALALQGGTGSSGIAISCAAAGASGNDCAMGGSYQDVSNEQQAMVDSETNGVWASALALPGLTTLNADGVANVSTISCASTGSNVFNCGVGGSYQDASNNSQSFLDDQGAPASGGGGGGGGGGGATTTTTVPSGTTLTLTADNEKVATGSPVAPQVSVSGLATDDTAVVTGVTYAYAGTGTTKYGPTGTAPTKPGSYTVTPAGGAVSVSPASDQSNYATTYAYVAGTLVITKAPLKATRVVGRAVAGHTVSVRVLGTGFTGSPRVRSNTGARTAVVVTKDRGTSLTLRVTVRRGTPRGRHVFTITEKNGAHCRVYYLQR